jgi:O-acetyl-ADP-ribose deacetylase (regulator of RNase III)
MKIVDGDLIKMAQNGDFDVIVHGCNCFCAMGSGIAKGIKKAFPEAYEEDLKTVKGDINKLGTFSYGMQFDGESFLYIVNGYTQYHWSKISPNGKLQPAPKGTILVDYIALRSVFADVKSLFSGSRIGYPMIGAGLARGHWGLISQIIDEELEGEDHTLVRYVP